MTITQSVQSDTLHTNRLTFAPDTVISRVNYFCE